MQSTKETENYTVIQSEGNRYIRGQSGDMTWIHISISNKTEYYKYWNSRIRETKQR